MPHVAAGTQTIAQGLGLFRLALVASGALGAVGASARISSQPNLVG